MHTVRTPGVQVIFLFSDSGKGEDVCYTNWNTRGDEFGNCGYSAVDYIACDLR